MESSPMLTEMRASSSYGSTSSWLQPAMEGQGMKGKKLYVRYSFT